MGRKPKNRTSKYLRREYVDKQRSTHDIAKEWSTYPNKIRRELIKFGISLRDKSKAQKAALKSGRSDHPTEGRSRPSDVKEKISDAMAKNWEEMPKKERRRRSRLSRQKYHNMSDAEKEALHKAAGEAIREASKQGSKMEKYLLVGLKKAGHEVYFHKKGLIASEDLEIDLFLPEMKVAIEVDGPAHFLPIWGEESLKKHKEADARKTGLLIGSGFIMIRIKHMVRHTSNYHMRKVLTDVLEYLDKLSKRKHRPPKGKRLIEIEVK